MVLMKLLERTEHRKHYEEQLWQTPRSGPVEEHGGDRGCRLVSYTSRH